jgi:hypothetical protein
VVEGRDDVTRRAPALAALALAAIGAVLDVTHLGSIPGVSGDEAQYGALALGSGDGERAAREYFGPHFVRMVAWSTRLLGATPEALRLPSALAATAATAIAALALARSAGAMAGVTFGLLLLSHPALLVFARTGWDVSLLPASVTLLILCVRAGCATPQRPALLVTGALLAGLCASFHPTGWLAAPAAAASVVAGLVGWARARAAAGVPRRRALQSVLVAALTALAAFVAMAWTVLPVLPRLVGLGEGGGLAGAARPPASLGEIATGAAAIRWISGEAPLTNPIVATLAVLTLLLAAAGLVLGIASRDGGERGAALFATIHLVVGGVALARTDLAPPGNVRYAVGLFPSLLYAASRAPDLVSRARARRGRTARLAAGAARAAAAVLVLGGLWAWWTSYWRPLHGAGTASESTFVPGRGVDAKLAAIRAIDARQREDGEPPAAIVARDWNLFHSARFFSGRRYPVLRIDAFTPEEFVPRLQALFAERDRLYVLVFERAAGEDEPLVRYLAARLPGAGVERCAEIPDRRGRNLVSVYGLGRGVPR